MCGICGEIFFDGERQASRATIAAMSDALVHRGPDADGFYVKGPVALGSRRLSIIDVEGGRMPISNEDGTIWIVYNGEVYNFPRLRRELAARGHVFATQTDTETIVHLYEERGEDFAGISTACSRSPSGMSAGGACYSRATRSGSSRCTLRFSTIDWSLDPRSRRCSRRGSTERSIPSPCTTICRSTTCQGREAFSPRSRSCCRGMS